MNKIKSNQIHSMIEYLITQAIVNNKTGTCKFSVPYYELEDKPENFEQVYLVLEIKTYFDDSKQDPYFINGEEENEEQSKTSGKNKKH